MQTAFNWICLAVLLAAQFLAIMDIFIINVAIPAVQKGLHATDAEIQLVIAVYLLGYAIFLITGGRAGDFFGKKKVFIWSTLCFTLSSGLCGLAETALQLNAFRFLQGISASFMMPQVLAYMHILFTSESDRAKAFGLYGITIGIATMAGQFLGGFLTSGNFEGADWRLIFFINLPIGVLTVIIASFYLKESRSISTKGFDYIGISLLTAGLACLIYPLIQGRELHWPLWSKVLLGLSIILLLAFVVHQRNRTASRKSVLINTQLFGYRSYNIGLVVVSLFFIMLDSYFLMLTLFLQDGLKVDALYAGVAVVCQGAGFIGASILSVQLVTRYGKKALQTGVAVVALSIVAQMIAYGDANVSLFQICVLLALHGTGVGLVLPSLLNVALKGVPANYAGAASGVYSTFQQTATALGICIVGGLFFSILQHTPSTDRYLVAFRYGNWVNVALLMLVILVLNLLPDKCKALSCAKK